MAAGEYSDHGALQFYISGTRTCLALTMHAILTITVTTWSGTVGRKRNQFSVCYPCGLVLYTACLQLFLKAQMRIVAFYTSNFPSVNCMQSTDSKHSISQLEKRVCTSLFCSKRKSKDQTLVGQPELKAQLESSTGLQHLACEWLHIQSPVLSGHDYNCPLLVLCTWICIMICTFHLFKPEQTHPPSSWELALPQDQQT